ncbi:crotonase/enoyl-CoA hydratase family protein [Oceanobacter mangrovi]|uniref:crotonase/enoyl-CoA hydratase family protein n=1 Tax=Oceanobacter mangrovi TaxID=2862510 RepID=UPI001C8D4785|nr:crotonase/enoyl-CoA hydratase family protein [Oceanobacter mangrovi]
MKSESPLFQGSRIVCQLDGHIAQVRLNRPEKMNGLDLAMFRETLECARRIRQQRQIRVVILAGNGHAFCAGLDFKAVAGDATMIPKLLIKWPWSKANLAQKIALVWRDLPVPVIAALHGCCFGGGLQMALAADFRFAHPDTRLSIMEIKWGLIPDMSILTSLTTLTRQDIAKELTMTGREFSAAEALQYGLLTAVDEQPLERAQQLAEKIAAQSPNTVVAAKRLFNQGWKLSDRAALRLERWIQYGLLGRANQKIAMHNGLTRDPAKRKPFIDR